MATHAGVVAPLLYEALVFHALGSQEVGARSLMGDALVHRHHGIEQDAEVGACCPWGVGAHRRRQVSACREAHDSHVVGIDAPCRGRVAHGGHGAVGVGQGDGAVALGHAILQHKEGDALTVHPVGPLVPLVVDGQMRVAAAWKVHDGAARGLGGQVGREARSLLKGDDKMACGGCGGCRGGGRNHFAGRCARCARQAQRHGEKGKKVLHG